MLRIVRARVRLRNDKGPTGELGPVQEFIEYQGLLFPLSILQSFPGTLYSQVEVVPDERDPYEQSIYSKNRYGVPL